MVNKIASAIDPHKTTVGVFLDLSRAFDIWLKCNKLSVNIKKTHYVIFKPTQKKFNASISLSFGGKALEQSNITGGPDALGKYLFILRKNLSPVP